MCTSHPACTPPHLLPRGWSVHQCEAPSAGQPGPVLKVHPLGLGPWFLPYSEQRHLPLGPVGPEEAPESSLLELGDGGLLDMALGHRLSPGR